MLSLCSFLLMDCLLRRWEFALLVSVLRVFFCFCFYLCLSHSTQVMDPLAAFLCGVVLFCSIWQNSGSACSKAYFVNTISRSTAQRPLPPPYFVEALQMNNNDASHKHWEFENKTICYLMIKINELWLSTDWHLLGRFMPCLLTH